MSDNDNLEIKVDGMTYDDFLRQASSLIAEHWSEAGWHREEMALEPDHNSYRTLEKLGMLHIVTAWFGNEIVGYLFILLMRYPRSVSHRVMADDIWYVKPDFRKYLTGPRLRQRAMEERAAWGADIVLFHDKHPGMHDKTWEREGFEIKEVIYGKTFL